MAEIKKTPVKKTVKKVAPKKAAVKVVAKELPKETGLKLSVYNLSGKSLESITLPKEIFDIKINPNLMAQSVRVYLANQRRGTSKTKSRGEVKISTRKIYRQKGTGRARHGAASAPIFVGGGIAFGPRPRDYSLKLNQNMRRVALFSALTSKLKDGEVKIVSGFEKIEPKTRKVADAFKNLQLDGKKQHILLVIPNGGKDFENIVKAARNIKEVSVLSANLLNTYEVLVSTNVLFMKGAIDSLKETFVKGK